jgi:hypothetical protein
MTSLTKLVAVDAGVEDVAELSAVSSRGAAWSVVPTISDHASRHKPT